MSIDPWKWRVRAVLLGALLVGPALSGCLSDDGSDEAIELATDVQPTGQLREWDLWVNELYEHSPREGKSFIGFAFGTSPDGPFSIPGPEIRVTEGDLVRVRLHNPEFHTIHWHGVSVPWAMDGVPFMTQGLAEGVYTYEFVAFETGTYWYHCHVDAPSHVDAGLFGAFIVEPADAEQDPAFDREATLIFHEIDSQAFLGVDYLFGAKEPGLEDLPRNPVDLVDGSKSNARQTADIADLIQADSTGMYLTAQGPTDYYPIPTIRYRPFYDTFMINGKSFPDTEPVFTSTGETVRIRLVNAGQLVHTVHLHGHHFLVTHKDGYNLPAPYYADTVGLFPGERYDIYVNSNNPGIWDLHDHGGGWGMGGFTSNDYAFPGGMNTMLVYEDFEYAQLPMPESETTSGDYVVYAPSYKGIPPAYRQTS